jgi:hypothetical protein
MLLRNNNTGAFDLYDFGNNHVTGYHPTVAALGSEWHVAGVANSVA